MRISSRLHSARTNAGKLGGFALPPIAAWALLAACGGGTSSTAGDGGLGDAGASDGATASCTSLGAAVPLTTSADLNAYPPYALAGCTLVYVADTGALVRRDLTTGAEDELAPKSDAPRRPAVSSDVVTWETVVQGVSQVVVLSGGTKRTLAGAFHHAGEPRAARGAVVFTAFATAGELGDTDVVLYDVASDTYLTVAGGPAQQRFADVSDTHVAITDFLEDPDGRYDDDGNDLADIDIYDRTTRGPLTARKNPGKDAFPKLASQDRFGYLHWGDIHPEPKFQAFGVRAGRIQGPASEDLDLADVTSALRVVQPTARSGVIEWITDDTAGAAHLFRAAADGSAPPHEVTGLDATTLYAPIAADGATLLAVRPRGGMTNELRVLPR